MLVRMTMMKPLSPDSSKALLVSEKYAFRRYRGRHVGSAVFSTCILIFCCCSIDYLGIIVYRVVVYR